MTGLRHAVARWRSPFVTFRALIPEATVRAGVEIERRFSGIEVVLPKTLDLAEIHALLRAVQLGERTFATIGRIKFRRAPWALFASLDEQPPLADDDDFSAAFVRECAKRRDCSLVVNLVRAFLMHYPKGSDFFHHWREEVFRRLEMARRLPCVKLRESVEQSGLLDANGPERLWGQYLASDLEPDQWLKHIGLDGPLVRRGLVEEVFQAGLRVARNGLGSSAWGRAELGRLYKLALFNGDADQELRFAAPHHRIGLLEAMLIPFGEGNPDRSLRPFVRGFVLEHFGDPRLDAARWQGVSDAARRIFHGWLVEDTLEDFFRLLEYVSRHDEVAHRHWRYRKAFWSAYLAKGVIRDAWVVLAPNVDHQARQRLSHEGAAYGKLRAGAGVLRNHAVLILCIERLVITEWSHTGKYRIWLEGAGQKRQPPALYRPEYNRAELTAEPEHEGSHTGSERGRWQGKLSDYIRKRIGVRVTHQQFMPRT